MFNRKRGARSDILVSVSSKAKERPRMAPITIRSYETATLTYELSVDYLTAKQDQEGREGIREDLKAKMLRKVDEFMDSIRLED